MEENVPGGLCARRRGCAAPLGKKALTPGHHLRTSKQGTNPRTHPAGTQARPFSASLPRAARREQRTNPPKAPAHRAHNPRENTRGPQSRAPRPGINPQRKRPQENKKTRAPGNKPRARVSEKAAALARNLASAPQPKCRTYGRYNSTPVIVSSKSSGRESIPQRFHPIIIFSPTSAAVNVTTTLKLAGKSLPGAS